MAHMSEECPITELSWIREFGPRFLRGFLLPALIFLSVSLALTFKILSLPNAVIGDNFAWTRPNIVDILGPVVVRQSYMGDAAVLSTFRTGFLFPLTLAINSLNLSMTWVYPFLFYFLSMFSFYALSSEFLEKKLFRVVASIIFVVNPVTPYYSASVMSAFVIVFLPLALKFLINALRQVHQESTFSAFSGDFAFCSVFLALAISAHEQFLPTAGILAGFMVLAFAVECYRKYGLTALLGKKVIVNVFAFAIIVFSVNAQLLTSAVNIISAPFATYFTARFNDFLANVDFTYSTANLITLLRLGGDSSTGLMQNSWFDSSIPTNIFGYAVFVALVSSAILLILRKNQKPPDRRFFLMSLLTFIFALCLIIFIGYLPENKALAEKLFSLPLQSWENPSKLRVLLLLSGLTASLYAFRELEAYRQTRNRKIISGILLAFLAVSVFIYNSPWVVGYPGFTPLKQIAEGMNWGELYDKQYSDLSSFMEKHQDERGIVVPYTHKGELYVPPNLRLFQLVSDVNQEITAMTLSRSISWSKLLGLLSAKYVVSNENYDPREALLFPKSLDDNLTRIISEMNQDSALKFQEQSGNFTVFENDNALPKAYATRYYVLYDEINTLKYAFDAVDFKNSPVFIGSEDQIGRLVVPSFIREDDYELYALGQSNVFESTLPLSVSNGNNSESLNLQRTGSSETVDWFSASRRLLPGDVINVSSSDRWALQREVPELTLNSTSFYLGDYDTFLLNFSVSLLQRGEYSVQGPRVIIDAGNLMRYLVMFHDNGVTELGIWKGDVFTSGVIVNPDLYDLRSTQNSIDVGISKVFDEVKVSVNGNLELTFPVDANASAVSLGSDGSVSRFVNVELATKNVARIFAVRKVNSQPSFSVRQCDAEETVLEINSNGSSDYAVVVQYLNTPLRVVENGVSDADPFRANIFFNGWIISPESYVSAATLTIRIANSNLALGLLSFSILFTLSILAIGIVNAETRRTFNFSALLTRLKGLRHLVNLKRKEPIAG